MEIEEEDEIRYLQSANSPFHTTQIGTQQFVVDVLLSKVE